MMLEPDPVKAPAHYRGDGIVDAKRAMMSMLAPANGQVPLEVGLWWGNAFKYLWRAPMKGQMEQDIDKAIECLENMKAMAKRRGMI